MAEVTSVTHETKTVTVEWGEGDEIKGKEVTGLICLCLLSILTKSVFQIDFEQVFKLNPGYVLPKLIATNSVVNNNNIVKKVCAIRVCVV